MASTLPYYGSKCRLARSIIQEFPAHRTFVEACAGSAAVLVAKQPSRVEVLNDLDSDLVNFYQVLRDRNADLVRVLKLTPYSRDEHDHCRLSVGTQPLDDVERARRYFVATSQSYSGIVGDPFSRSTGRPLASYFANRIDGLHRVANRLRRVLVENLDALTLIQKYDSSQTLFYVDPPYDPTMRSAMRNRPSGKYRFEMSLDNHAALLTVLNSVKGKVLLSGYHSPLYDRMLKKWRVCWRKDVQPVSAAHLNIRDAMTRTEVLWANF